MVNCHITIFVFSFLLIVSFGCSERTAVPISTKKGPIVGVRVHNPNTSVSYDAFLGVPYGETPTRFQLAEPRKKWTALLYTQSDGPACPQTELPFSEDCLYLNVFTPVNASNDPGKLPVIVFIHGSAFSKSSSNSQFYTPDFLVNQSVILVTMNFRLGAYGFLTLGSKVAPGNLGLHDNLLALQWVQEEISVFGGDPGSVTLYGSSSGSVMCQMLYLSVLSAGYFQRAIASSGSALTGWGHVSPEEGARRARLLAEAVGCDVTLEHSALLVCLQNTDINYIVGNQTIVLPTSDLATGRNIPFIPVLDSYLTSDKPFFNDTLENLMDQALLRAKPLLTGINTDEGIIKFEDGGWALVEDNLKAFIPDTLTLTLKERFTLVRRVRTHYFNTSAPDDNKVRNIINTLTDTMFGHPSVKMTRHFANFTYGYLFAYHGSWAPTPSYFRKYRMLGVNHAEELVYLFNSLFGVQTQDNSICPTNLPNIITKHRLVSWWTNFAKTGVPDPNWATVAEGGYLVINDSLSSLTVSEFESRYYNFWENIYQYTSAAATARLTAGALCGVFLLLQSCIVGYCSLSTI